MCFNTLHGAWKSPFVLGPSGVSGDSFAVKCLEALFWKLEIEIILALAGILTYFMGRVSCRCGDGCMCRNLEFCYFVGGLKIHFDIGTCISLGVCHRALPKAVSQRYLGVL